MNRRDTTGQLRAWGSTGRVLVAEPVALAPATTIARRHLRTIALAADRRRTDAEVHRVPCAAGHPVDLSPLLARLVRTSLEVAESTHGLVDLTVRPSRLGPLATATTTAPGLVIPVCGNSHAPQRSRSWRDVRLDGPRLVAPGGTTLDLRATALAEALDDIVLVIAQLLGTDAQVRLAGRSASRGRGVATVRPRDVTDPRTGNAAPRTWALVEVTATSCLRASSLAVAAAVLGTDAVGWLEQRGARARLTRPSGEVVRLGGTPVVPRAGDHGTVSDVA